MHRKEGSLLRTLCVLLCVWLAAPGLAADTDTFQLSWQDPRVVSQGEFLLEGGDQPPPASAPWRPIELPDLWDEDKRYYSSITGWYRFKLVRPPAQAGPWGVYLWRYSMNARIYFNDDLLVDGGSFEDPAARNIHRPLLARIPQSSWQAGDNWVYVHLRVYPGYGYLLPIGVGPYDTFLPEYESRLFYQIELSEYLFVVTLLVTLLGLVLWLVDRQHSTYGYFAAASLLWTLYSLNPFVQDLPFSMKTWLWLLHSSVDGFAVLLMLFLHRHLNYQSRAYEWCCLGFVGVASLIYALLPIGLIGRYSTFVHIGSNLIILNLIGFCIARFWRTREIDAGLFAFMLCVLVGLSLHDLLLISGAVDDMWIQHFLALNLGAPIVFVVMVAFLTWRLRGQTVLLRQEVAAATEELEESFSVRESLERQQAAAEERERIYRDLHDDIGARLLSLVYRADSPEQADLARDTLREMRAIVSRTVTHGGQLRDIAAQWFLECDSRCEEAGCKLVWDVEGDTDYAVSANVAYQITRILRELITNALQHGQPEQVEVSICAMQEGLTLTVKDDGRGFKLGQVQDEGSGIANVRRRAEEIGAQVDWLSSSEGTRVSIALPQTGG